MHDSTKFILDLRHAEVRTLSDESTSWPKKDKLYLKGFRYKDFELQSPSDAVSRLAWLRLQPKEQFNLQSFDTLANTFRDSGHEVDATEVLVQKNEDLRRFGSLSIPRKAWNHTLGLLTSHGYRPFKTLWYIGLLILIGTLLFGMAGANDLFTQAKLETPETTEPIPHLSDARANPEFNPLVYSIDLLLKGIELGQEESWRPNLVRSTSEENRVSFNLAALLGGYIWIHKAIGWFLASIAVLGIAGLIKR